MRVIPVIDLMNGQVVRGVAGRRSEYRPIESSIAVDALPSTVARAFVERFGFDTVYVADLDAIQGGTGNVDAWGAIRDAGLKLWLDAGIGSPQSFSNLRQLFLANTIPGAIVIALECLKAPDDDRWFDELRGSEIPAIFSLDLKDGVPLRQPFVWPSMTAMQIGRAAYDLYFRDIIVLDLADVGVGRGTRTLQLCRQLSNDLCDVRVISGGGVRGIDDLRQMVAAGCDAALVGSALHDGLLTVEDVREAESWPR